MVNFSDPTTDRRGVPVPVRYAIQLNATSTDLSALARIRYKLMDPRVFFVEDGNPTSVIVVKGLRLSPIATPVDTPVEVRATVTGIAIYFIEVRLEQLDSGGNVISSKTDVMTIQ